MAHTTIQAAVDAALTIHRTSRRQKEIRITGTEGNYSLAEWPLVDREDTYIHVPSNGDWYEGAKAMQLPINAP